MDTFDQELALCESTFDAKLNNAVNVNRIDCFMESVDSAFMESGALSNMKDKTISFFRKIKDTIVEFFKKCKELIEKKIQEVQLKHAINKIKKSSLKTMKKIKIKGSKLNELALKIFKQFIEKTASISKRAVAAKSLQEVKKLEKEYFDFGDKQYEQLTSLSTKEHEEFVTITEAANLIENTTMNEMGAITVAAVEEMTSKADKLYEGIQKEKERRFKEAMRKAEEEFMKQEEEAMRKAEEEAQEANQVANAKKNLLQRMATKLSTFSKKCGSFIMNHKKGIMIAIVGVAGAIGTVEISKQSLKRDGEKAEQQRQDWIHFRD